MLSRKKSKNMLKYLLFELLHCKYEYLQILAVLGQISQKNKNMLKDLIVLELLHCR